MAFASATASMPVIPLSGMPLPGMPVSGAAWASPVSIAAPIRAPPAANISRREASALLFSGMAQIPQFLPDGSMDLRDRGVNRDRVWASLSGFAPFAGVDVEFDLSRRSHPHQQIL